MGKSDALQRTGEGGDRRPSRILEARSMIVTQIWEDPVSWDAFVESLPDASNYHRWIWRRVIQETYGHAPYYLAATSEGRIEGVLPLVLVKSRLFEIGR